MNKELLQQFNIDYDLTHANLSVEIKAAMLEELRYCHKTAVLVFLSKRTWRKTTNAWVEWCEDSFNFKRRYCFYLNKVGSFINQLFDNYNFVQHGCTNYQNYFAKLDVIILDQLSGMVEPELQQFCEQVADPSQFNRDQLLDIIKKIKKPDYRELTEEEKRAKLAAKAEDEVNARFEELTHFKAAEVNVPQDKKFFDIYAGRLLTTIEELPMNWTDDELLQFHSDIQRMAETLKEAMPNDLKKQTTKLSTD